MIIRTYGIAVRMTDKRTSFYTAKEEMKSLMAEIKQNGKALFASNLSVTVGKTREIQFIVFFDNARELYYFGELEKIEHDKEKKYFPESYNDYSYKALEPHRTWFYLKSLCPISKDTLNQIYVVGEDSKEDNTLAEKIQEPRFPRVYVYLSSSSRFENLVSNGGKPVTYRTEPMDEILKLFLQNKNKNNIET